VPNAANVAGTVTANAQPNITSIGVLNSLSVTGNTVTNLIFQQAPIISLGANAGFSSNIDTISIGNSAGGNNNQGQYAIAIGSQAGENRQGNNAVSIGPVAGISNQGTEAIAIGSFAGRYFQGSNAIAFGQNAGNSNQGESSVAIGRSSGNINQGANAVSVGRNSGNTSQGAEAVAVGHSAGNTVQGNAAVAVGWQAGYQGQKQYAVAIGAYAGNLNQGANSVAIGSFAGYPTVANNAIVINGDTVPLDAPNSGLYIAPIRNNNANITNSVYYNTATKELTYGPAPIIGNVTSNTAVSITAKDYSWTFEPTGDLLLPNSSGIKDTIAGAVAFGFNAGATTGFGASYAYSVASSGSLLVSVGYDWQNDYPLIITTSDGVTWTQQNSEVITNASGYQLQSIVYNGFQFVAVGYGVSASDGGLVLTSTDGVNWTLQTPPYADVATYLLGVTWSGSQFVAVGFDMDNYAVILTSPDGVAWTQRQAITFPGLLNFVTWTGSQYIAVGSDGSNNGLILTSTNGSTWTQRASGIFANTNLSSVAFNNSNQYVSVGVNSDTGSAVIITSTDSITWNSQSIGLSTTTLTSISYGSGKFVVGTNSTKILTSTNGNSWTISNIEKPYTYLNDIIYVYSQFIAVGGDYCWSSSCSYF
jgi:hypothetical protein